MTLEERVAHALADPEEILADVDSARRIKETVERLMGDSDDPLRRRALTDALTRLDGQLKRISEAGRADQ